MSKHLSIWWDLIKILGQPGKAESTTGQIRFLSTLCSQVLKIPTVSLDKLLHWLMAFLIMKKFFLLANLILHWFSLCPLHFTLCLYDVFLWYVWSCFLSSNTIHFSQSTIKQTIELADLESKTRLLIWTQNSREFLMLALSKTELQSSNKFRCIQTSQCAFMLVIPNGCLQISFYLFHPFIIFQQNARESSF